MYFKHKGKEYLVSQLKEEDLTVIFQVKVKRDKETNDEIYKYKYINFFCGRWHNEEERIEVAKEYIDKG